MSEILEDLKKAIVEYDIESSVSSAKKAVEEKIDPIRILDAMTAAIRQIGDGFGRGELWLPELISAAEAMSSAMPMVEEEIKRTRGKRESLGTVVAGTVYGDIHNIGKTMVCTLLTAEGFVVHDLGVDIKAEEFMEAIRRYKPDILAMSALMTTTIPEQRKVIETLKKEGLRDKIRIMVGGAAVNERFAKEVGADGYDPTALGAVKLARTLVGK
jgi:corrinoid protein of di/trimethylamine methyltransferase